MTNIYHKSKICDLYFATSIAKLLLDVFCSCSFYLVLPQCKTENYNRLYIEKHFSRILKAQLTRIKKQNNKQKEHNIFARRKTLILVSFKVYKAISYTIFRQEIKKYKMRCIIHL